MNCKMCIVFVFFIMFFLISCSESSEDFKFDCNKLCDKSLECGEIKDSDLQKCKEQCNNLVSKDYFEKVYWQEMEKCLSKESCNDIDECAKNISEQCPPPPDVKDYANVSCDKMIECKATTDTKEVCVKKIEEDADQFRCITREIC